MLSSLYCCWLILLEVSSGAFMELACVFSRLNWSLSSTTSFFYLSFTNLLLSFLSCITLLSTCFFNSWFISSITFLFSCSFSEKEPSSVAFWFKALDLDSLICWGEFYSSCKFKPIIWGISLCCWLTSSFL